MTDRKPIRLIALDLDGTLLDDEKRISGRNRESLRAAAEPPPGGKGVVIALASGRMTDCIVPSARALGIDCAIIAYNGGMARGCERPAGGDPSAEGEREGRPVLFHRPLPSRYGRELIDFCRGRYLLNFYHEDRLYAENTPALRRFAEIYSTRTGARYEFVPDLAPFAGTDPTKNIIITDHPERERLHGEWTARWGDETTIVKTDPEYLEFLNRDTDKGVALEGLCRALGIPIEQAMALGDGDNDAEMLARAGLGVAMANATGKTKAAADEVSRLTNAEDGVADAVERHVLA